MIKTTQALLAIITVHLSLCNIHGIQLDYSQDNDLFTIQFHKHYFQLMNKVSQGVITLPYTLSSPASSNKINDNVRDDKNFIPSQIVYRFDFKTPSTSSADYNYIEVLPCNTNSNKVKTLSIKRNKQTKNKKQNDYLKIVVQRNAKNICLQVMDFAKMVVLGKINIPLYREVYVDWGNQYKFGSIHKKVKVGEEVVIRLHLADYTQFRHYYFQNHNTVIGNRKSKLKVSQWEQKWMENNHYVGLWRNEGNKNDTKTQGHNQFRFYVTKPGISVLKFVQRDTRKIEYPLSVVIVKLIAH